jgi:5'-nucleotidase
VTAAVTGAQLVAALEDMADYTVSGYGKDLSTHHLYVSGVTLSLDADEARGRRITDVRVRQKDGSYAPLDPAGAYTLVMNSFMAAGGDKSTTLAGLEGKYDTGFIDSEAMLSYIEGKTLSNLPEKRIRRLR